MIDEKQIQAFYDEFYELHIPGGSYAKLAKSSVRQVDKLKYFEEDKKGSITPGKQADLVILERNPLLANPDTLKDISIVETFARGQSVYKK